MIESHDFKINIDFKDNFGITLSKVPGKRIIYHGLLNDGTEILICAPQAKLQAKGFAWIDITQIQIDYLQTAPHALFAFCLKNGIVYFITFEELKPLLTEDSRLFNKREKEHWKLHVYPGFLQVQGNDQKLSIKPNNLSVIKDIQINTKDINNTLAC